jgi:hypothetical protein
MKTFPPLDPEHAAFLRDRAEPYLAASPGLAQLRQELLGHGGLDVVWVSPEPHLEPLLERGRLHPKRCLRRRFIADSECHANGSSLWYESEGRIRVGRGYAISERGIWFNKEELQPPLAIVHFDHGRAYQPRAARAASTRRAPARAAVLGVTRDVGPGARRSLRGARLGALVDDDRGVAGHALDDAPCRDLEHPCAAASPGPWRGLPPGASQRRSARLGYA